MSGKGKESYYKMLGTTAKISNARIKEKYIQALKAHPPETDPEGFEKVRRAYETLKDPEKRKQYDLIRKYGNNVEGLLEEASAAILEGEFEKADKLLQRAAAISPNDPNIMVSMMVSAIAQANLDEAEVLFEKALGKIPESETEERATLYTMKASMLSNYDYTDEAIEAINQAEEIQPGASQATMLMRVKAYIENEEFAAAWEAIETLIPSVESETFDDFYTLLIWCKILFASEKWGEKGKVQSRFRKFIKNLTDEEEKDIAHDELYELFAAYYEDGSYREAEFLIDLLSMLDNTESAVKELKEKTKTLARVQKDIHRLETDEDAFPLLFLDAFDWFYEDIIPSEELSMMKDDLPPSILAELEQEKEVYAAGILRLKKKYPSIYKYFKGKWDQLFDELTKGFNREMKRDLRRIK